LSTLSYSAIISERHADRPSADAAGRHACQVEVRDLNFWYGERQALLQRRAANPERSVLADRPSGCGKSTFLRVSIA